MSHPDQGVEVDFYDKDDGNITVIHETQHSTDDVMADFSTQSHEALHNLNVSAIRRPDAKEVAFSNIKVRTYPICIGDNPACSDGVPLTIDWQYLKEYNFTVDYYERKLEKWVNSPDSPMHPNRYPRKTEDDLRISAADRMQLLYSAGVLPVQATVVFRQVEAIRRNRRATIRTMHLVHLVYAWERIQRATRNATVGRATKRQERLLLQPYRNQIVNDSVEISVDDDTSTSKRRSWFPSFRKKSESSWSTVMGGAHSKHGKNKPTPIVLNQSYETVVATNTPQSNNDESIVSYNGDALFPPTPTSPPLAKTIRERNMTEFEPRVIDMTGQVSGSYGKQSAIVRSPTMKRTNKPRDRVLFSDNDDYSSDVDLIGEGIMDRSMNSPSSSDHNNDSSINKSMSVDRYAIASQPISPQMEDDDRLNASPSGHSVSSGRAFNFRQLEWTGSPTSGSSQRQRQTQHVSGSNHARQQQQLSASNHSQRDAASVASTTDGSIVNNNIGLNLRQLMGMNAVENADRGYFLDADERYY